MSAEQIMFLTFLGGILLACLIGGLWCAHDNAVRRLQEENTRLRRLLENKNRKIRFYRDQMQ